MGRLAHGWEGLPMIGWFRRRAEYRALIEADAKALIERLATKPIPRRGFASTMRRTLWTQTARLIIGSG